LDATKRKQVRNELREVELQLRTWDPIGVIIHPNDPESPLDEYDSYAPGVLKHLRDRSGPDVLARHLNALAAEKMGVPRALVHDQNFARKLILWWNGRKGEDNAV
jgi:hypothetical protein